MKPILPKHMAIVLAVAAVLCAGFVIQPMIDQLARSMAQSALDSTAALSNRTWEACLTNGVQMFDGLLNGTNGVCFSLAGTNYWILLAP